MTPNIASIIRQHVSLEVRCIDRLYLHAWMPKLQTSGGLCYFLQEHLGHPLPSPALFRPLHDRFVSAVPAFAQRHHVPLIVFEPKQRKDDVVAAYRQRVTGREGVVVIGVAQEKMRSFKAQKRSGPGAKVTFDFSRQSVSVNHLQQPTVETGQRVSALRFGDPRVMALLQALCAFTHLPRGFRNRELRPHVAALLGRAYSPAQMTYDLRRLRLKGLIHRLPGAHRYTATTYGLKVAFFYSKLYLRVLRPNWQALLPAGDHLPRPLRDVLDRLDTEIRKLHEEATLAA